MSTYGLWHKLVKFSNGSRVLRCIGDIDSSLDVIDRVEAKTIRDTDSKDYKSSSPTIPKGATVVVKNIFNNFYGEFLTVTHEGYNYYIKSADLEV